MTKLETSPQHLEAARRLSPLRNSSTADSISELAAEQLVHFNIEVDGELGRSLLAAVERVYQCQGDIDAMWQEAQRSMSELDVDERVTLLNAKKFLSFQLAKVLDTLQNQFRASYQNRPDTNSCWRGGPLTTTTTVVCCSLRLRWVD